MKFDSDCIFCKIAQKQAKSDIVYEDNNVIAFKDIDPVAPVHILIIPKEHIVCLNDLNAQNIHYIDDIFKVIPEIAKKNGVFDKGYRIVANTGDDGGQAVKHLHFHLIGGKKLPTRIEEKD